jgi:hypothetical protein
LKVLVTAAARSVQLWPQGGDAATGEDQRQVTGSG